MAEQVTSAKATAKTVRIAARKVRLVVDLIRGKSVAEAAAILDFTPRGASPVVSKVLKSAVANAENNFDLDSENLFVSEAFVNEGATLKRFRPRAKVLHHQSISELVTLQSLYLKKRRGNAWVIR